MEEKVKSFVKVFIKAKESLLDSFVMEIVIYNAGKVWVFEVNRFGEGHSSSVLSIILGFAFVILVL